MVDSPTYARRAGSRNVTLTDQELVLERSVGPVLRWSRKRYRLESIDSIDFSTHSTRSTDDDGHYFVHLTGFTVELRDGSRVEWRRRTIHSGHSRKHPLVASRGHTKYRRDAPENPWSQLGELLETRGISTRGPHVAKPE